MWPCFHRLKLGGKGKYSSKSILVWCILKLMSSQWRARARARAVHTQISIFNVITVDELWKFIEVAKLQTPTRAKQGRKLLPPLILAKPWNTAVTGQST